MIFLRSERKATPFFFFFVFFICLACMFCVSPVGSLAAENFPFYPSLKASVKFWEDIYSRYSTHQGVLHDEDDLSRVYAVIDLVDWETSDSAKINSERIRVAKSRISTILTNLGSGIPPRTVEERKVAGLFSRERHTTFHEAREKIRLQLGQSDRFKEGVIRSGRYLLQFRQIFISHGLPADLVYLPHVESSFNPKAYSKAGAAGLWQFTRSTGKEYMTISQLVDERYDPYLATQAAAQLLKENYTQLQTWPLALTAYNYGRAGMVRALRDQGSYENIYKSYDQGYFKFASRNFYSEFLAAMRVARRLGANSRLPFERPEATTSFRLKEDVPIGRLRSSFRISAENFARLNPALMQPVLDGEQAVPKGYLVRLPAAKQEKTRRTP
jgi:membrane-bound lytic murein transglycosylase D